MWALTLATVFAAMQLGWAAPADAEIKASASLLIFTCTYPPTQPDMLGKRAFCEEYISGTIDAVDVLEPALIAGFKDSKRPLMCLPKDAYMGKLVTIVVDYFHQHREDQNLSASALIIDALAATYPCND